MLPGPPVQDIRDDKADASTEHLQRRIDEIVRVVRELVRKVNGQ
jgi:hypothetical protein